MLDAFGSLHFPPNVCLVDGLQMITVCSCPPLQKEVAWCGAGDHSDLVRHALEGHFDQPNAQHGPGLRRLQWEHRRVLLRGHRLRFHHQWLGRCGSMLAGTKSQEQRNQWIILGFLKIVAPNLGLIQMQLVGVRIHNWFLASSLYFSEPQMCSVILSLCGLFV